MAKGGQKTEREIKRERQSRRQTDRWTDSRTCSKRTAAAAAAATGSHRRFKYLNRRQTIERGRAEGRANEGEQARQTVGQTFR